MAMIDRTMIGQIVFLCIKASKLDGIDCSIQPMKLVALYQTSGVKK